MKLKVMKASSLDVTNDHHLYTCHTTGIFCRRLFLSTARKIGLGCCLTSSTAMPEKKATAAAVCAAMHAVLHSGANAEGLDAQVVCAAATAAEPFNELVSSAIRTLPSLLVLPADQV